MLYAVLFTLPFAGIRILEATVAILAPSKNLSLSYAVIGLKVGLSFVPELIAALALLAGGLITRNVTSTVLSEGIIIDETAEMSKRRGDWGGESGEEMISRV